jgi:signal transduction histidine kinase
MAGFTSDRLSTSARAERRAVAGALAAELGHDLQCPLNLFRLCTDRLARGGHLDQEDISLLQEELARLSQLNDRLRALARTSLEKVTCSPRDLVTLALAGRQTPAELEIDASDAVSVCCDSELVSLALRELIDNAVEARATRAGVRYQHGAAPGFCVWDDGDGFSLTTPSARAWGVTTRPGAAGLGLTLAMRVARAHGFNLELRRVPPHTEAWLLLPVVESSREPT